MNARPDPDVADVRHLAGHEADDDISIVAIDPSHTRLGHRQ